MQLIFKVAVCSISFFLCYTIHSYAGYFIGSQAPSEILDRYISDDNELTESISEFSVFEMDIPALYHYVSASENEIIDFELSLENEYQWNFSIEVNDLRGAKGFQTRVQTDDGIIKLPKQKASTYLGNLSNFQDSRVRLSIREHTFLGLLAKDGKEYFIEPLSRYIPDAPKNWIVIYDLENVIERHDVTCGTDHFMDDLRIDIEDENQESGLRNNCKTARIAIAADGAMVTKFGGVQNTENEILDIFNIVEDRYLQPQINIGYEVATIFISANVANDPWNYDVNNFGTYLSSFRDWGQFGGFGSADFAVASLWTNKNFNVQAVGLAYLSSVCSGMRYNANRHFTLNMTRLVQVQAHELGHNWGASHAPDNNTPNNTYVMSPSVGNLNVQWHPQSVFSITNHKNSRTCLSEGCPIAPISIFSTDVLTSCNGEVQFTDQSLNVPSTWLWDFGDGTTSTDQNPTHIYQENGLYTVTLITTNEIGEDTLIQENYVHVNIIEKPEVDSDERCHPGQITFFATGTEDFYWYDKPSGGNLIHTGSLFSPNLSETTTFYVETSTIPDIQNIGEYDFSFGPGEYFTSNDLWGLNFDVHSPIVLKSVKVFSDLADIRVIEIYHGGSSIYTEEIFIPEGESRIDLNINLQAGNSYLIKVSGITVNLFRNDAGAEYPYTIDSLITITGNNTNTGTADDYYYYFYDWEVHEPGCVTSRTEVTGYITECQDDTTSIEEKELEPTVTIFPNPGNGRFETFIETNIPVRIQLEIYNNIGQLIYQKLSNSTGVFNQVIDISNHASGMYNLRLIIDGEIYTRRLVLE